MVKIVIITRKMFVLRPKFEEEKTLGIIETPLFFSSLDTRLIIEFICVP